MIIRIITIAATVAAVGFAAPASATSLGAAGQTIAQGVDSPVLQVGKKWHGKKHGKHGKWHGKHGKWHGKWHGHGYGYYPTYGYPYHYGGCFKQVQVQFGGHYVWQTVKIC